MIYSKQAIFDMYEAGASINEIAKSFNKDYSTIREHLIKNKVALRDNRVRTIITKSTGHEIISLYESGMSMQEVAEKLKLSTTTVARRIKRLGKSRPNKKYFLNDENFLKNIDSEWKAYFLGLLWADGNMRSVQKNNKSNSISITLTQDDSDILSKLAEFIFFGEAGLYLNPARTHVNKKTHKKYTGRPSIRMSVHSKIVYQDLLTLGCTPRKSCTAIFPNIPPEYLHHFLRGYFDGDGWFATNNVFGIIGSYQFCEAAQSILLDAANVETKTRECGKVCRLIGGNMTNLKAFYAFLYKDATIFLKRKKEKAEQLIACAKEQTSAHIGVSYEAGKWRAYITKNKKNHYIGRFNSEEEAFAARLNFASRNAL